MNSLKKKIINLRLLTIYNPEKRAEYLKRKNIFYSFGDNVWWQPFKIPTQPKLVKIGNNVKIATEVLFLEHDIIHKLLNTKYDTDVYNEFLGTITIGDNTFIGGRSIIMYNVNIGKNCIVGCGSIVTKDIPDNSIAVGCPAKVIGKTDDLEKKYLDYSKKIGRLNLHDDENIINLFWNDKENINGKK